MTTMIGTGYPMPDKQRISLARRMKRSGSVVANLGHDFSLLSTVTDVSFVKHQENTKLPESKIRFKSKNHGLGELVGEPDHSHPDEAIHVETGRSPLLSHGMNNNKGLAGHRKKRNSKRYSKGIRDRIQTRDILRAGAPIQRILVQRIEPENDRSDGKPSLLFLLERAGEKPENNRSDGKPSLLFLLERAGEKANQKGKGRDSTISSSAQSKQEDTSFRPRSSKGSTSTAPSFPSHTECNEKSRRKRVSLAITLFRKGCHSNGEGGKGLSKMKKKSVPPSTTPCRVSGKMHGKVQSKSSCQFGSAVFTPKPSGLPSTTRTSTPTTKPASQPTSAAQTVIPGAVPSLAPERASVQPSSCPSVIPSAQPSAVCGTLSDCFVVNLDTASVVADLTANETVTYTIDNSTAYSILCFVLGNVDLVSSLFGNGDRFDVAVAVADDVEFFWAAGEVQGVPNPVDYLVDVTIPTKTISATVFFEGRTCVTFNQTLELTHN